MYATRIVIFFSLTYSFILMFIKQWVFLFQKVLRILFAPEKESCVLQKRQ